MKILGNKAKVAIGIGEFWEDSKQHQNIQTWLDNRHLTELDSIVYLPTYYSHLEGEIRKLKGNSFFRNEFVGLDDDKTFQLLDNSEDELFKILCFDLTTYPANCYLYNNGREDRIVYSFWDPRHEPQSEIGKVYGLAIDKEYIIKVLSDTLGVLSSTWV